MSIIIMNDNAIDYEKVYAYRSAFEKWVNIATRLNVSISALNRWRVKVNFQEPCRKINDDEVIEIVTKYVDTNKNQGERMCRSHIRSLNLYCTKLQITNALNIVDPDGRINRRLDHFTPTQRQEYISKGPHNVWHMDGHHKLNDKKWKIVIHGAIDGFTRLIVFLKAGNSNSSKNVLKAFINGIYANKHINGKLPYSIRFDKGMENVLVADLMIQFRGEGNDAVLVGKSIHNQRIERVWVDVKTNVVKYIEELFIAMENDNSILLNRYDVNDIFCLHELFIPHINDKLNLFITEWNHHMISNINASPLQILLNYEQLEPPIVICPPIEQFDHYLNNNIDIEDDPDSHMVHMDPIRNPFNTFDSYEYFKYQIDFNNAHININDSKEDKLNKYKWVRALMYQIINQ